MRTDTRPPVVHFLLKESENLRDRRKPVGSGERGAKLHLPTHLPGSPLPLYDVDPLAIRHNELTTSPFASSSYLEQELELARILGVSWPFPDTPLEPPQQSLGASQLGRRVRHLPWRGNPNPRMG